MPKAKDKTRQIWVDDPEYPVIPELLISVVAKLTMHPKQSKGKLHLTLQDTAVSFENPETDEKIGEIISAIGGAIELRDAKSKCVWTVKPMDLFRAFQIALEKAVKAHGEDGEQGRG